MQGFWKVAHFKQGAYAQYVGSFCFFGLPWWLRPERICLQCRRPRFDPWVGKIPWRRAWQPTPVFLPGESPWTEEPGGLQFIRMERVGHDWSDLARKCPGYSLTLKSVCQYLFADGLMDFPPCLTPSGPPSTNTHCIRVLGCLGTCHKQQQHSVATCMPGHASSRGFRCAILFWWLHTLLELPKTLPVLLVIIKHRKYSSAIWIMCKCCLPHTLN